MGMRVRGQNVKMFGHHHNERDYTLEDLQTEVKRLVEASENLQGEFRSSGLMDRVKDNIDAINPPTSERDG